ncbi:MAG: ATP-binding protein, partial [Eubacteriaceae bacterium]|nr:ATP-binding protein [Eubacteriaceae bacterium]
RQSVRKLSGQFITRGLKLIYEPINKKVVTDEKWLSFIIEQILSNALKYTPSGSITIEWTEPDGISVKDTGMGIAPEDLPRIFEKGYTGYHGREDKKASGLGLYLCRRISDNLGHSISVTSVLGQGSIFTVHLTKM